MTAGFQVSLLVFGLLVIVMFLFTRFWQTEYEKALKERNKWRDKYYNADQERSDREYAQMHLNHMYNELLRRYDNLRWEHHQLELKSRADLKVDKDLLDAVKKGMVAAHPDKGGNADDFIRFRKVYNELKGRTH